MRKMKRGGMRTALCIIALAACGGDAAEQPDAAQNADTQAPAAADQPAVGANVQLPEGVTQDMVAQGRTVFESSTCWTCHGMDAAGGPLAPNLRDDTWLNTDGTYEGIVNIVRTGVPQPEEHPGPMPAMGGAQLSDEQINQVAAYVYAISRGG